MAPELGHLVHMAAHVYFRLGRYRDAAVANERAIAADRLYLDTLPWDAPYIKGYVAHNYHYLAAAAMMGGDPVLAEKAAAELAKYATTARDPTATEQHFIMLPLHVHVRFGRWAAILNVPQPSANTAYTNGVWHYARGIALARTGDAAGARRELKQLTNHLRAAKRDDSAVKNTHAVSELIELSAHLLRAEIASASGDDAAAVAHARRAVKSEEALEPDEPPIWSMPARHVLGALLLESGHAAEAARVYRKDLGIYPDNAWSLSGISEFLVVVFVCMCDVRFRL
jgi:tetratricopeptide (TPR) repeat protein